MNVRKSLLLLVIFGIITAACTSAPATGIQPTQRTAPSPGVATAATATNAASAADAVGAASAMIATEAVPAATTAAVVQAASTPAPPDEEIDCMSICHVADPNENLGAGAKPQPASHQGYTTCIECHNTPPAPALPDTHLGRLDEACAVCHLAKP